MRHDDRFFQIACWCAALITVTAFVALNVDFSRSPQPTITSVAPTQVADRVPARPETVEVVPVPAFRADSAPGLAGFRTHSGGVVRAAYSEPADPPSGASREIRRFVAAVDALAGGRLPRLEAFELPARADVLVRYDSDGRLVVAAGTHRRYRDAVEVLTSADVHDLAAIFFEAEPAMQVAYRDMSLEGGAFNDRVAEAVDHLLALEIPEVEPAMRSRGRHWGFADDELEALSPLQRHLLLMGRDNALAVQIFLRRLRLALALPGQPVDSGLTTAHLHEPPADDPDVTANRSMVSSAEMAAPDTAPPAAEHQPTSAEPVAAP